MPKKTMEYKACENKYLHRDFHVSLNIALDYLGERFETAAVEEYLTDYSNHYYAPKSLAEIKEYLIWIYKAEEAEDNIVVTEEPGKLHVEISKCPAVAYMKTPSKYYRMTTEVVYGQLARISGLVFQLHSYDEETGATSYTFKEAKK